MPSSNPTPEKLKAVEAKTSSVSLPSANDMQIFAKRFSPEEWTTLCAQQDFLDKITNNISECRIMAEKILAGKYKSK